MNLSYEEALRQETEKIIYNQSHKTVCVGNLHFSTGDNSIIKLQNASAMNNLNYMYEYLCRHDIHKPFFGISFIDYSLLSEFRISSKQIREFLGKLVHLGVLLNVDNEKCNSIDKHSAKYDINYVGFLELYELVYDIYASNTFYFSKEQDEWFTGQIPYYDIDVLHTYGDIPIEQPLIDYSESYFKHCTAKQAHKMHSLYEQIDNAITPLPIKVIEGVSTVRYKKDYLLGHYIKVMQNCPLVMALNEEVAYVRHHSPYFDKNRMHIKYGVSGIYENTGKYNKLIGYTFNIYGRHYNDFCSIPEHKMISSEMGDVQEAKERSKMLIGQGFDGEFDLHSAIYSVCRLFNQGSFDVDWDIKNEVCELFNIERNIVKTLSFRIFFSDSFDSMWKQYIDSFLYGRDKSNGINTPIGKDLCHQIYDYMQERIGFSHKVGSTIFLFESLLELRVMHRIIEKGYSIRNVYDCFFFKTCEMSTEEIKDIINKEAVEVYRILHSDFLNSQYAIAS